MKSDLAPNEKYLEYNIGRKGPHQFLNRMENQHGRHLQNNLRIIRLILEAKISLNLASFKKFGPFNHSSRVLRSMTLVCLVAKSAGLNSDGT